MGVAGKGHALWLLPSHRISLEHPGAASEAVSQPQRPAQLSLVSGSSFCGLSYKALMSGGAWKNIYLRPQGNKCCWLCLFYRMWKKRKPLDGLRTVLRLSIKVIYCDVRVRAQTE